VWEEVVEEVVKAVPTVMAAPQVPHKLAAITSWLVVHETSNNAIAAITVMQRVVFEFINLLEKSAVIGIVYQ